MSEKGIYVIDGEQTKGPYSLKQVKAMYESGQFTMETLWARKGDDRWWKMAALEREMYDESFKAPAVMPRPEFKQAPAARKSSGWKPAAQALLVVICLGCAVLGISAVGMLLSGDGPKMMEDSRNADAHYTAEQFIKEQIVGAKTVSAYGDSVVTHEGNTYYVAVNVDGLNAFGGPVRQALIVEMTLAGEKWRLVEIHHR